ncbi:MAG: patatin-like phospholipase family protein [Gemmatimonadales bacterium]|jgi:patatin-like phospholipase/acyl hydrolase
MADDKRILAIDGGGIRGIVPAMVLAEIERRTGKPTARLFDLVAGTSTGGILALALAKPNAHGDPEYTAERLIELYEHEGTTIFSRSVWHTLRSAGNLLEEKYPAAGLEDVLARYFGETTLAEALMPVLVTGYEIERRIPFFFKSERARAKPRYDLPMGTVARATSAAPTYFEPALVNFEGDADYYALIDGGVYANNPGLCAYVEGVTLFGPDSEFLVVSLGTGVLTRRLPLDAAVGWGLAEWAQPILNVVFDGVSDTVDYQLRQLLPERAGRRRYYRLQVRLDEGMDDLDDASRTNLRVLKLLAEELIRDRNRELDELCEALVR